MGSLILCHRKKAKQPYEIVRIHRRIYTLEELCYHFCSNLYLVDHTIINKTLCGWLADELEMYELSEELGGILDNGGSIEQFLLTVLTRSYIYSAAEITKIQNVLERLKSQSEAEREKYKADSLMKSGEYNSAILVYQSIVNRERDANMDDKFYGKVYGCLGSAYGRMFFYEEAAQMYERGFALTKDTSMLKAYIYCCSLYMPEEKYVKMLSKEPVYLSMDSLLKEEGREAAAQTGEDIEEERLERWKKEYRRVDRL